ncbi:MAG: 50S ribosomal protein L28 [Deltaproteobacteria bacterium]|nr:50S ribosomal protein L28 [Deltaproteobacteria bacterium]
MARKCLFTNRIRQVGHNVSHANNRTKRIFNINLQKKRIFVPWMGKFVTVKLSTKALRTIDKLGLRQALLKLKKKNPSAWKSFSRETGIQLN